MSSASVSVQKRQIEDAQSPIFSNVKSGLYGLWVLALFWNMVTWPVLLAARELLLERYLQGEWGVLFVLLAPLIGAIVLCKALWRWLHWRKFGATPLFLNPFPGSIGGHVAGKVRLPETAPTNVRYDVSLVCVYTYETRAVDNKVSQAERMLWQNSAPGELRRGIDGLDVLFCFDVPEGLTRSEAIAGNYHHWRLHLHAECDGDDLDRLFDIPVHPTCMATTLDLSKGRMPAAAKVHKKLMGQMRAETVPGLLHMYFPRGRQRWLGTGLILGGGALLISSFFFLKVAGESMLGLPITFTGLIMLFISVPIILFGIYVPAQSLDVRVARDAIAIKRALFGVSVYQKRVAISQVHSVVLIRYRGSSFIPWRRHSFKVIANIAGGGNLLLAEELNGQDVAEEALRFIRANGNLVV
ncbi:hypothetical protein A9Q99_03375 [Gammaproteobacteria bacterium 45_16_T64]|nr:hypothetical protein A9Q99_03375 [Gammaproteobacteria bacterium 45_16_T64]